MKRLSQLDNEIRERVRQTIYCRVCDYIPKVECAGEVNLNHDTLYQIMHNGVKVLGGYHGKWMEVIISTHGEMHEKCRDLLINTIYIL